MVQTRSASKAESSSLNGAELKLLKTIYIGKSDRANVEEGTSAKDEAREATKGLNTEEQLEAVVEPCGSNDVAESETVSCPESGKEKSTEESKETDDVIVVWSSAKPNDQSDSNATSPPRQTLQSQSCKNDQSVDPVEDSLPLKRHRSVMSSSRKKANQNQTKKSDILLTPTRRSRRLASEEPETFSIESLPIDLGGTRHYSKSGNESAEEEPKQKVSDEGAGGSLQRVTATSSIKVIAEEPNELNSSLLCQSNGSDETTVKNGKQMVDKKEDKRLVDNKFDDKTEGSDSKNSPIQASSDDSSSKVTSNNLEEDKQLEMPKRTTPNKELPKDDFVHENVKDQISSEVVVEVKNGDEVPKSKKVLSEEAENDSAAVMETYDNEKDGHMDPAKNSNRSSNTTVIGILAAGAGSGGGKEKKQKSVVTLEQKSRAKKAINNTNVVPKRTLETLSADYFPDWDETSLINQRRADSLELVVDKCIEKAYSLLVSNVGDKNCCSAHSLVPLNDEVMWQQLNEHNRKLKRLFYKLKHLFKQGSLSKSESALKHSDEVDRDIYSNPDEEEGEEDLDESIGESYEGNEAPEEENTEDKLFNLGAEDLKNLDSELKQLDEDGEASQEGESGEDEKPVERTYRKTVVDDQFFSLGEMEAYLDEQENKGKDAEAINIFEEVDDDDKEDAVADYHYAEFYGENDYKTKLKGKDDVGKKKRRKISESDKADELLSPNKRVHFEIDEEVDDEEMSDEKQIDTGERILLGALDNDEATNETAFQKRQKRLKAKIAHLEEENLAPRSWELSGEVTAANREENGLLEKEVDYDYTRKIAPVITVDKTQKLEALIIQRIKDKAFDDVTRKERELDTAKGYRALVKEEMTKKSLAEVYEEEFQKSQNGVNVEEKDERKVEIEKRMKELFFKIDTLFHYNTNPPEVRPEVSIVTNMASLRKEEVGPLASTEEMLVAPEEVKRHERGEVKGKDERTDTDRARERRKKKKLQKLMDREKRRKSISEKNENRNDNGEKNEKFTKPSAFFKQLQETSLKEVKEHSKKNIEKKINKGNKKKNAGAKFIL